MFDFIDDIRTTINGWVNTIRFGRVDHIILAGSTDMQPMLMNIRHDMQEEGNAPVRIIAGENFGFDDGEPIDMTDKILYIEVRPRRIIHVGTFVIGK